MFHGLLNTHIKKIGDTMKKTSYLYLVALAACLLVFAGCGDESTDESASTTTNTTGTTSSTSSTSTSSTSTTTNPNASPGEVLYNTSCLSCHSPASSLRKTTLSAIKGASMSMGLTDAQLQEIVDYLATL
jgi:uncharacterized lipoprotein YajG